MSKTIDKRFPADTKNVENVGAHETFLTNKKIDGELYAYFQSKSKPFEVGVDSNGNKLYETRVLKSDLDSKGTIGKIIGISQPTLRKHIQDLIVTGYLIEESKYYILPTKEDFFFMMPLDTVQFLLDVVKEPVVKTLVWLGHQYEWKKSFSSEGYVFTLEELGRGIGINLSGNNSRDYTKINNYLTALENFGFIKIAEFYEGRIPKKRLYYFTKEKSDLKEKTS